MSWLMQLPTWMQNSCMLSLSASSPCAHCVNEYHPQVEHIYTYELCDCLGERVETAITLHKCRFRCSVRNTCHVRSQQLFPPTIGVGELEGLPAMVSYQMNNTTVSLLHAGNVQKGSPSASGLFTRSRSIPQVSGSAK